MKIRNLLFNVFEEIAPVFANNKDNKKIKNDLNDPVGLLGYIENSDKINVDTLKAQYDDSLFVKERLEDKAKTNIAALTISISLILGLTNLLNNIYEKTLYAWMDWVVFGLTFVAIAYMITAGILSINVIISQNIVYKIRLSSFTTSGETLRQDYDKCIYSNQKQNMIRNNYIFTAYQCIRNSVICLLLVFIFMALPLTTTSKSNYSGPISSRVFDGYNVVYSDEAIKHIIEDNDLLWVENIIAKTTHNQDLKDGCETVIIDHSEQKFIKLQRDGDKITVIEVENYEIE